MALESVQTVGMGGASASLAALVAADGSASHDFPSRLGVGTAAMRNLSDVIHQICLLHARHPDVIEQAARQSKEPATAEWLAAAAPAFVAERSYVVRLVAAAGPLPSTPGQAASEAAIAAQRHALDMLAQSDRVGCADGTALALILDWQPIRKVLDLSARRLGVEPPACALPSVAETLEVADALASRMAIERAMLFGAQQMLAQHRGLWDLLEARASARDRH